MNKTYLLLQKLDFTYRIAIFSVVLFSFLGWASANATSSNEYDGIWEGTTSCGVNLSNNRPGFTDKIQIDMRQGEFKHTVNRNTQLGNEKTEWKGSVKGQTIYIDALAKRDAGDQWTWKFVGKTTSNKHIVVNGGMFSGGNKIRDCTLQISLISNSNKVLPINIPEQKTPQTPTVKATAPMNESKVAQQNVPVKRGSQSASPIDGKWTMTASCQKNTYHERPAFSVQMVVDISGGKFSGTSTQSTQTAKDPIKLTTWEGSTQERWLDIDGVTDWQSGYDESWRLRSLIKNGEISYASGGTWDNKSQVRECNVTFKRVNADSVNQPQKTSQSTPAIQPFIGFWVQLDTGMQAESCAAVAKGGDSDTVTEIKKDSFTLYGNPDCRITKSERHSENLLSIEARCGNRLVKESWVIKENNLERKGQNYTIQYKRCP